MKTQLKYSASDSPEPVRVSLLDSARIKAAHDRIMKERGCFWESPLARHHRRLRERKAKR